MPEPRDIYKQIKNYNQSSIEGMLKSEHSGEKAIVNAEQHVGLLLGAFLGCGFALLIFIAEMKKGILVFNWPQLLQNQLVQVIWWICSVIVVGGFLFCLFCEIWFVARRGSSGWLERVMLAVFLIGLLGPLSVGLFIPEADMTRSGFRQSDVATDSSVTFVNPADGIPQILCIGTNQRCEPASDTYAPPLDGGLHILPGQSVSVVFYKDGDFYITSQSTAHMNITIHVSLSSRSSGGGG